MLIVGKLQIKLGGFKAVRKATLWVLGGAACVITIIVTGGFGAIPILSKALIGGTIFSVIMAGKHATEASYCFKGKFDIVQLEYTPFAIFSNKIPIFDINFFNPNTIDAKIVPVRDQLEDVVEKNNREVEENSLEEALLNDDATYNATSNRAACIADWYLRAKFCGEFSRKLEDGEYDLVENMQCDFEITPEDKENIEIIGRWIENGLVSFRAPESFSNSFSEGYKKADKLESQIETAIKGEKNWEMRLKRICSNIALAYEFYCVANNERSSVLIVDKEAVEYPAILSYTAYIFKNNDVSGSTIYSYGRNDWRWYHFLSRQC